MCKKMTWAPIHLLFIISLQCRLIEKLKWHIAEYKTNLSYFILLQIEQFQWPPLWPRSFKEKKSFFFVNIQCCEEPPWPRGNVLGRRLYFESCNVISFISSQDVILAKFSLYMHKSGLKPHSVYFNDTLQDEKQNEICTRWFVVCDSQTKIYPYQSLAYFN